MIGHCRLLRHLPTRYRKHLSHYVAEVEVGGRALLLESGSLARLADGCVQARTGDTTVLVTVVGRERQAPYSFMPLTVEYKNRASAYGRIPSNFLRREIAASDADILTSRMIDRSIRPGFTRDCYGDCQVLCTLIAHDGQNDPDVLSINGASAALHCSSLPWNGPVAAVRVAMDESCKEVIINPTRRQMEVSPFSLMLTANKRRGIMMLEGAGGALPQDILLKCIRSAVDACEPIIEAIERLKQDIAREKRPPAVSWQPSETLKAAVKEYAESAVRAILADHSLDKMGVDNRITAIRQETAQHIKEKLSEDEQQLFDQCFTDLVRASLVAQVFETGLRRDGRSVDDLRPISCQVDMYKPLHGSALFQKGQSQVLCTVTFDSKQSAFKGDVISLLDGSAAKEKKFMLHYTFAPFATNEISSSRGLNRRELGHGALAEKALKSVVPKNFPFTIRLAADVLESNGSTSMASVCAGSLALMDSGVPIDAAVSGVAIGLVMNTDGSHRLLTDITGMEDYFGEMDFKIGSSRHGITAMQMDTKMANGVKETIFAEAIEAGLVANGKILDIMDACIAQPRSQLKANGPAEEVVEVPVSKRARFLGPAGIHLKRIEADTGAQITQIDENHYSIFVADRQRMNDVRRAIDALLQEDYEDKLEFGAICTARIVELKDSGAMVVLHASMQPVFLPNSQLDTRRVAHSSSLGFKVGQEISVKYFGRDPVTGSMRLSRKVLQQAGSSARVDILNTNVKERKNPWAIVQNSTKVS